MLFLTLKNSNKNIVTVVSFNQLCQRATNLVLSVYYSIVHYDVSSIFK